MMKKFSGFVILAAIFIAGARTLYNRRQANSFLLLADKKSLIDALNDDNPSTARFQQLLQDFEARLSEDYKTQNLGAIPSHHKTVNVLKEMLQALPPDAQTLQHWRDMLSQQERFEALAQKLLGADAQDLAASVASLAPDLAPQEPAGPIVRRYLELPKTIAAKTSGRL